MELSDLDLSKHYSYADYLSWKFKEKVELIRGKIMKMSPAPSSDHQQISWNITLEAGNYLKEHQSPYRAFHAPFDVRLPMAKGNQPDTVLQPDLCIICDTSKIDRRGCNGAPDLVVEILSPGNPAREMQDKYEVYEESGVKEYWLVMPAQQSVQAFVLDEEKGKFYGVQPVPISGTLTSHVFPDLHIELERIFPEHPFDAPEEV